MNAENKISGKYLKPLLCLIKNLLHDYRTNGGGNPGKEAHLRKMERAFPYYEKSDLEYVFELAQKDLKFTSDIQQITRLYDYYFNSLYGQEAQEIQSPRLYHFLKQEHLVNVLDRRFLYPSTVKFEEYVVLSRIYKGALQIDKMGIINDESFKKKWVDSNNKLLQLRGNGASQDELNQFLKGEAFTPGITCFTELSTKQIKLHANHYGSFGLGFSKEPTVFIEKGNGEIHQSNYIRPIYYCDNVKSSTPWSLLKLIHDTHDENERRALFEDLFFIKSIDETLFHPKNIYSVLYEREWRYVASEKIFEFKLADVKEILVPESEYQSWLHSSTKDTEHPLTKISKFCSEYKTELRVI